MKRILAIFLTAVIVISAVSMSVVSAFAAEPAPTEAQAKAKFGQLMNDYYMLLNLDCLENFSFDIADNIYTVDALTLNLDKIDVMTEYDFNTGTRYIPDELTKYFTEKEIKYILDKTSYDVEWYVLVKLDELQQRIDGIFGKGRYSIENLLEKDDFITESGYVALENAGKGIYSAKCIDYDYPNNTEIHDNYTIVKAKSLVEYMMERDGKIYDGYLRYSRDGVVGVLPSDYFSTVNYESDDKTTFDLLALYANIDTSKLTENYFVFYNQNGQTYLWDCGSKDTVTYPPVESVDTDTAKADTDTKTDSKTDTDTSKSDAKTDTDTKSDTKADSKDTDKVADKTDESSQGAKTDNSSKSTATDSKSDTATDGTTKTPANAKNSPTTKAVNTGVAVGIFSVLGITAAAGAIVAKKKIKK